MQKTEQKPKTNNNKIKPNPNPPPELYEQALAITMCYRPYQ